MLVRSRETVRALEREAAKATASGQGELDRVMDFVGWLCATLQAQLYPGTPFTREILGRTAAKSTTTRPPRRTSKPMAPLTMMASYSSLATPKLSTPSGTLDGFPSYQLGWSGR